MSQNPNQLTGALPPKKPTSPPLGGVGGGGGGGGAEPASDQAMAEAEALIHAASADAQADKVKPKAAPKPAGGGGGGGASKKAADQPKRTWTQLCAAIASVNTVLNMSEAVVEQKKTDRLVAISGDGGTLRSFGTPYPVYHSTETRENGVKFLDACSIFSFIKNDVVLFVTNFIGTFHDYAPKIPPEKLAPFAPDKVCKAMHDERATAKLWKELLNFLTSTEMENVLKCVFTPLRFIDTRIQRHWMPLAQAGSCLPSGSACLPNARRDTGPGSKRLPEQTLQARRDEGDKLRAFIAVHTESIQYVVAHHATELADRAEKSDSALNQGLIDALQGKNWSEVEFIAIMEQFLQVRMSELSGFKKFENRKRLNNNENEPKAKPKAKAKANGDAKAKAKAKQSEAAAAAEDELPGARVLGDPEDDFDERVAEMEAENKRAAAATDFKQLVLDRAASATKGKARDSAPKAATEPINLLSDDDGSGGACAGAGAGAAKRHRVEENGHGPSAKRAKTANAAPTAAPMDVAAAVASDAAAAADVAVTDADDDDDVVCTGQTSAAPAAAPMAVAAAVATVDADGDVVLSTPEVGDGI